MYILLVSIIVGLFIAMLFVNVYFRIKVFKSYKKLIQAHVEFGVMHIFDKDKMAQEILPKYPNSKEDILTFVHHLRYSIKMASVLIALITAVGAVMMYFREQ